MHPSISIVIAARNDNYGGDFVSRLQQMVTWNLNHFARAEISVEFVCVNYNPDPENTSLKDAIHWPVSPFVSIKLVTVPFSFHQQILQENDIHRIEVLEFVAKNIGIRRAEGDFILITNADVLFHPDLINKLSELQPGILYRSKRFDYQWYKNHSPTLAEIKSHITSVFEKGVFVKIPKVLSNFSTAKHYARVYSQLAYIYFHTPWQQLRRLNNKPILSKTEKFLFKYNFNACGDFLCLDKTNMMKIGGFDDLNRISTHVDSLFMLRCIDQGISIHNLEYPVFHQEHSRRYDFSSRNIEMDKMWDGLIENIELLRSKQALSSNKIQPWGFPDVSFDTTIID